MRERPRLVSGAILVVAMLGWIVPTALASPAGTVDARNLGDGPLQRVVVTWRGAGAALPAAARATRLSGAVPGIRAAATVSADTDAWWLPGARRGAAAVGDLHALAGVPGVPTVA